MALHDAKQFLAYVDNDKKLRGMLNVVAWNAQVASELAAARGFKASAADVSVAISQTWGDLSEEDLRNTAGGAPGGNSDHPNPPPGHNPDRDNGWSPPPGDVSGKSCFFGRRN